MKYKKLPSQSELKEYFRYDSESGKLYWAKKTGRGTRLGHEVGNIADGYRQTSFKKNKLLVHRIIWKLVYGTDPSELDHINGDRADNRIENLRSIDRSKNTRNKKLWSKNSTGQYGVVKHSQVGWIAQIGVNGETKYLGWYKTKKEAIEARKAAEIKYGYHKNHGRKK